MRISPIVHNFNNVSFKANHRVCVIETSYEPGIDYYTHTTRFFRYPRSDEFVVSEIKNMDKGDGINIISAGCSFGEEPYTYSMLLEDIPNVNIDAFDVSQKAIDEAINPIFILEDEEDDMLLSKKESKLTPFEKKCRELFHKHFHSNDHRGYIKVFEKKDGHLENCNFKVANIKDFSKNYKPKSADVILCRFVLYQLKDDRGEKGILQDVLKQLYDVLKDDGLLVLSEAEDLSFDDTFLKQAGFECVSFNHLNVFKKAKTN